MTNESQGGCTAVESLQTRDWLDELQCRLRLTQKLAESHGGGYVPAYLQRQIGATSELINAVRRYQSDMGKP